MDIDLSGLSYQDLLKLAPAIKEQKHRAQTTAYEGDLYSFLSDGWKYIDPAAFRGGWHLEAIAEHLMAVTRGHIRRLCINVPPRSSKPVAFDSLVLCRDKGLIPLEEIRVGDYVWTHKGRWRSVIGVHEQGELPVSCLKTYSGREVCAASDHLFLTPDAWIPLGRLGRADVVGVVPCREPCGAETISPEEAALLGYMVGDGHAGNTPTITCADDDCAADIVRCATKCGFSAIEQKYRMSSTGYMLRRIALLGSHDKSLRRRKGYRGLGQQWLYKHGLKGKNSYNKMAPDAVMRGSNSIVSAFLGAYWSCDGFFSKKGAKRNGDIREDWTVGCDSVNREYLSQVQILLGRLGINSRIRQKISKIKTKKQGDVYTSYSLTLNSQDDVWRFTDQIRPAHSKIKQVSKDRQRRFDFDRIIWGDEVVSVEPTGTKRCLCLTVEEDSSFTANGFAVHNSSVCSVAWPAWTWAQSNHGPLSGPHVQFLFSSYAQSLSLRDSVKTRRLIESPWYQKHWGKRFVLTGDQNTKIRFENDKGGYRLATSVGGALTGEGAAILVCDDPHNAVEMESELVRQTTLDWWDESLSTRLNDQATGAYVVIMQRLHQEDLTGHIMTRESENWTWLMLPMEHELDRHCKTYVQGVQFWEDPRTEEGELLCAERFPEQEVIDLKRRLGPYASAGQLQQSPVPRGGGIIKEEWWQLWPEKTYPRCEYILASLDTAFTEKEENDPSALTIWGMFRDDNGNPRIMLLYGWQDRLNINDLVAKVGDTCTVDRRQTFVKHRFPVDKLLIENKSSGASVAQELHRLHGLSGNFGVELFNINKMGDKVARVYSIQHIFAEGLVFVPFPPHEDAEAHYLWADEIISQISMFPRGSHDDYVDSMSMAIRYLRDCGFALNRVERSMEITDELLYRPRMQPLYPA